MIQYPYDFIKWNYSNDTTFTDISLLLNRNYANDTLNNIMTTKTTALSTLSHSYFPITEIMIILLATLSIILFIGFITYFQYYKQFISAFYLESKRKNFLNRYSLNHYFNYIIFFIYISSLYVFMIYNIYLLKDEFEFLTFAYLFLIIFLYKIIFFSIYSYLFSNNEKINSDLIYYVNSWIHSIFVIFLFLLLNIAYANEIIIQIGFLFITIIFIYRWIKMIINSFRTIRNFHIIYFLYFCIQEIIPFLFGYSCLKNII
jgi:hypothetical protein